MQRRRFIKQGSAAFIALSLQLKILEENKMKNNFDVIIIGGSYSGLSAALALGRALRSVLIIDNGNPSNKQTPFSHNFLTQDGNTPVEITNTAKKQVIKYDTVNSINATATNGIPTQNGFEIQIASGDIFNAKKIIFATGITDIMPGIEGYSECWGISVLHCPYCHGYEVRNERTGILGNGETGFELSKLISHWTKNLTLFTNGRSTLTNDQTKLLANRNISIIEKEIERLDHKKGRLERIIFKNGSYDSPKVIYAKSQFRQHSIIPESLGCELTEEGYIKVNPQNKTTIDGIYACGDNVSRLRTVANAVAMGTTTGMMLNKELIEENFKTI